MNVANRRLAVTLYGLTSATVGILLVVWPSVSIWFRLLGLQVGVMGGYLIALERDQQPDTLRLLLRLRFAVPLGYLIVASFAETPLWLLLVACADGLWLVWMLRAKANAAKSQPRVRTSRFHNVALGCIPFGEGLGCVCLPREYAVYILGLPLEPGSITIVLFGLHTLYLAAVWAVVTSRGCTHALWATVWGRLVVAVAFAGFHWFELVGPESRLIWVVFPLAASSVWTLFELRKSGE